MKKKIWAIIIPIGILTLLIGTFASIYIEPFWLFNNMKIAANPVYSELEVNELNFENAKISKEDFLDLNFIDGPIPDDCLRSYSENDLEIEWEQFSFKKFSIIKSSKAIFEYSFGDDLIFEGKWRVVFELTAKGWLISDVETLN